MVTYKTIVVPTDGSENAKRALEHALAVADRNHAELIIVHVQILCLLFPISIKHQFPVATYLNKLRKIWKKLVKKFLTM